MDFYPFHNTLSDLREKGWRVAVHNDYRLNGQDMTFWLMTHPDGRYLKGEGTTDLEALLHIERQLSPPTPS
jgi:hypothetical protein